MLDLSCRNILHRTVRSPNPYASLYDIKVLEVLLPLKSNESRLLEALLNSRGTISILLGTLLIPLITKYILLGYLRVLLVRLVSV